MPATTIQVIQGSCCYYSSRTLATASTSFPCYIYYYYLRNILAPAATGGYRNTFASIIQFQDLQEMFKFCLFHDASATSIGEMLLLKPLQYQLLLETNVHSFFDDTSHHTVTTVTLLPTPFKPSLSAGITSRNIKTTSNYHIFFQQINSLNLIS